MRSIHHIHKESEKVGGEDDATAELKRLHK